MEQDPFESFLPGKQDYLFRRSVHFREFSSWTNQKAFSFYIETEISGIF